MKASTVDVYLCSTNLKEQIAFNNWGVSGERNVSRSRKGRKAATPPMSGRPEPVLVILIDSSPQPANPASLRDVFKRQSTDAARQMRAALAQIALLEDSLETRAALRRLRREMHQWDRIGGRQVRVRMPKPPSGARRRTPKVQISRASKSPLPRYNGPIIDREGRKGIFLDLEYDGAQNERNGVARRRIAYQFRLDHAQTVLGMPIFCSNMGADENEILACADMLEMVNRAARKNAKVGINAILQCPSELDLAGRVAFLERVAKHFDALGIAYCMTLHRPDPEGDQRNHHLHIWFTLRSIEHVGVRDWMVGKQLRTDLDGPAAMYALRRECADIATEICYEYGRNVRYTHLSNAARRLPHLPQRKLGKRRAAKVRRGEYDATNEANRRLIAQNEVLAQQLAEHKARAVRPIIISALSSTSVLSITLPRVAEVPALTTHVISVPVNRHAENVARVGVSSARVIEPIVIPEPYHQGPQAARIYARGIAYPATNPRPTPSGKGLLWSDNLLHPNATLTKVPVIIPPTDTGNYHQQIVKIPTRLTHANSCLPAIAEPVRTPPPAPQPAIIRPSAPLLNRGVEQIKVPNTLSNSGSRTRKNTINLPPNTVPAQKHISVPVQYGPVIHLNGYDAQDFSNQSRYASRKLIVLPQKASLIADRDDRSSNLVAEIEVLLAGLELQKLELMHTAPTQNAPSSAPGFEALENVPRHAEVPTKSELPMISTVQPPLNSISAMKEVWQRDRSKTRREFPDLERLSDMYRTASVEASKPSIVPAKTPPSNAIAHSKGRETLTAGEAGKVDIAAKSAPLPTLNESVNLPNPATPVRDLRWAARLVGSGRALADMEQDRLLILPFGSDEEYAIDIPKGRQRDADKLIEQTRLRIELVNKACEQGVVVVGPGGRLVVTSGSHVPLLQFAQRMYDEEELRADLHRRLRKAAENAAFAEQRRRREEAEKAALQPPKPSPPPSPSIPPPAPARKSGPRNGAKARSRRKGPYVPNRGGSPERS